MHLTVSVVFLHPTIKAGFDGDRRGNSRRSSRFREGGCGGGGNRADNGGKQDSGVLHSETDLVSGSEDEEKLKGVRFWTVDKQKALLCSLG